jgi:arginyl-tRNA synthetase
MKALLQELIRQAAAQAHAAGALPHGEFPDAEIEAPKVDAHGDYSTNFALMAARRQKMAPRQVAEALRAHIADPDHLLMRTEIAGPGFINFFLRPSAWLPLLAAVHAQSARYGSSDLGRGIKVQVEFVSSNPTGPLHVGHGRGAAVGDSMARILAASGYEVQREYYINDSGRQIQTLGRSVLLRYRQLAGDAVSFPDDCYQGDYIVDLARELLALHGTALLTADASEAVMTCARHAATTITAGMRQDLLDFGVVFDRWYSEQSLYDAGRVEASLKTLQTRGVVYSRDGALWFNTSAFGDEKDRVVVRNNGLTTYFASDIAYHQEKFERGFDRVIDVWGADHHGYIPRMKAAVQASGVDPARFEVILVQMVNLLRGGEPVAMSTRAGEFVTLSDVMTEVGRDAARFIFLTRSADSTLDFDLEVAKQKTNDNPVFYVQYVHARISSILRKAEENGVGVGGWDAASTTRLDTPDDIQLIKTLGRFPEVVVTSARLLEPHRVTFYLLDLAAAFHSYYNRQRVLSDEPALTRARLSLITGVRQVIRNGLELLGVSAPDVM